MKFNTVICYHTYKYLWTKATSWGFRFSRERVWRQLSSGMLQYVASSSIRLHSTRCQKIVTFRAHILLPHFQCVFAVPHTISWGCNELAGDLQPLTLLHRMAHHRQDAFLTSTAAWGVYWNEMHSNIDNEWRFMCILKYCL